MGRRAKNKQAPPTPLAEVNGQGGRLSAKKLGKRKAEFDEDVPEKGSAPKERPTKKVKESGKAKGRNEKLQEKGAKKAIQGKGKTGANVKPKSKKAPVEEDEESDEEKEEGGSSEGWEDVEDEDDLQEQRK